MPERSPGFTLIEILVTVIVIALAVALLLPSMGFLDEERPIERTARDLARTLELARDEAALQGRNFGLRFDPDGYEILDLDPDTGAWLSISDDELLAPRYFGNDVVVVLEIEDRNVELERERDEDDEDELQLDGFGNPIEQAGETPHVVILASGEVTPFELELTQLGSDGLVRLTGDAFGALDLDSEQP